MKTQLKVGAILLLSAILLAAFSLPSQARQPGQDVSATPAVASFAAEDVIYFADLGGQGDIFMQGPLASASVQFSAPPEWALTPGAVLHIDANVLISNFLVGQEIPNLEGVNAGKVTVYLNGMMIDSEFLQGGGQHTLEFAIPEFVLTADPLSGTHELVIEWDATGSCDENIAASLTVLQTSFIYLPHDVVAVEPSLGAYPRPFYQPANPYPASVVLAIPDDASQPVIDGALRIAASLGAISKGEMALDVVPARELEQARFGDSHLILVGPQAAFALAAAVKVPQSGDDGILFAFASPWAKERVAILATGASDEAILKAASALASGRVVTANDDNVAFVGGMVEPVEPAFKRDQTFAELGYDGLYFQSFGTSRREIQFYIPQGNSVGVDAYLDLSFNHSQLIDYLRSGITVRINEVTVASIRLSDVSSNLNTVRLIVPASAIRPGVNVLGLQVDITPRAACSDSRDGSMYVTILPDSLLHLPLTESPIITASVADLGAFPQPFVSGPLSGTTFVLPPDDPASWVTAAELAFQLGANSAGASFPAVILSAAGQAFTPETGKYIVIGQPGRAPAILDAAKTLPVAFDAAGNAASLPYAIDATRSTGFLEAGLVPGQADTLVLLVAGNNDQGLNWAGNALVRSSGLAGANFAIVQSNTSVKAETIGAVAESGGEEAIPGLPEQQTTTIPENLPPRNDLWYAIPLIVLAAAGILWLIVAEVLSWKKK